jgi:hypothetical protein
MKKNRSKDKLSASKNNGNQKITRKEAIKKAGKYAVLTAASTLIILSPKEGQATSQTPAPPGW